MKTMLSAVLAVALWAAATGLASGQSGGNRDGEAPGKPGLHARLFDTHLQPLLEVCGGRDRSVACINELWDVADVSGDGELSVAELTRILRIVSGKVAHRAYVEDYREFRANRGYGAAPEQNEAVAVVGIAAVGPVVSHALIANFDYDDNGRLSKAEALNDVAADLILSSVEKLPPEIRSQASKALGFLMQFIMKR